MCLLKKQRIDNTIVYDTSLQTQEQFLALVRFDDEGLVPVIVQDAASHTVLVHAWMNQQALAETLIRKQAVFWSRSRQELWHKGSTSGHYLDVQDILIDCDGDTLLLLAHPVGPACHTGAVSCFFRQMA